MKISVTVTPEPVTVEIDTDDHDITDSVQPDGSGWDMKSPDFAQDFIQSLLDEGDLLDLVLASGILVGGFKIEKVTEGQNDPE